MGDGIMWTENFMANFKRIVTLNLFQGLFSEKDAEINSA